MYKKPHPTFFSPSETRLRESIYSIFLQEVKRDIIFSHAQLRAPRRQEKKERKIAERTSSSALSCPKN
jgi:hypothetical protein